MKLSRASVPWLLLLGLCLFNAVATSGFLALELHDGRLVGALVDLLFHGAVVALLATGCVPLVAAGGVDLSVGATMALAASVAVVASDAWGAAAGLAAALCAGLSAGLLAGGAVAWLRLAPLLVTLVGLSAWRGAAQLVGGGGVHYARTETLRELGALVWLGLPLVVWVALAAALVLQRLWTRRMHGLVCVAQGLNPRASELAGLPVLWTTLAAYALSGGAAAVAGIASACEFGACDASTVGVWRELDVLVALVLGGASLSGGRVSVLGAVGGALAAEALVLSLAWHGASTAAALFARALVLVGVLALREHAARRAALREVQA